MTARSSTACRKWPTASRLGLILAAMIVSAAMVMRVDTTFRILGYPGFAMILFLLAGIGAAYLAVQIVRHDRSVHHR